MSLIYNEALADSKKLREIATNNAKAAILESVSDKIEHFIHEALMNEDAEDAEADIAAVNEKELLLSDNEEVETPINPDMIQPGPDGSVEINLDNLANENNKIKSNNVNSLKENINLIVNEYKNLNNKDSNISEYKNLNNKINLTINECKKFKNSNNIVSKLLIINENINKKILNGRLHFIVEQSKYLTRKTVEAKKATKNLSESNITKSQKSQFILKCNELMNEVNVLKSVVQNTLDTYPKNNELRAYRKVAHEIGRSLGTIIINHNLK